MQMQQQFLIKNVQLTKNGLVLFHRVQIRVCSQSEFKIMNVNAWGVLLFVCF